MWNWSDKSSEKNTQLNSKKMDETIVLYKLDISPCCRAVSIVARLIGLEHEEKYSFFLFSINLIVNFS